MERQTAEGWSITQVRGGYAGGSHAVLATYVIYTLTLGSGERYPIWH